MVIHLRSKCLYKVTIGTEVKPNSVAEKSKNFNRLDEAFGMLCLSILRDFLFPIENMKNPNELCLKIEEFFRNTNVMRGP